MQTRVLPIALSGPDYRRLERLAEAEDRDPVQQARRILKLAIRAAGPAPEGTSQQERAQ